MRSFSLAILAGALFASSAAADTIVQTTNSKAAPFAGFVAFNTAYGTLDSVTLTIDAQDTRLLAIKDLGYPPDPITFTWSINGQLVVSGLGAFDGSGGTPSFLVPISGSGSITAEPGTTRQIAGTGSATFDLDPTIFTHDAIDPFNIFAGYDFGIFNFADAGLYNAHDLTLTQPNPGQVTQELGSCPGRGQDACNFARFTLAYNFTPSASYLPEPSTWAMMLVGFGAGGMALRRQRKRNIAAAT